MHKDIKELPDVLLDAYRKERAENIELKIQLATLISYAQHADPSMVNEIMLGIEIDTANKMLGRKESQC